MATQRPPEPLEVIPDVSKVVDILIRNSEILIVIAMLTAALIMWITSSDSRTKNLVRLLHAVTHLLHALGYPRRPRFPRTRGRRRRPLPATSSSANTDQADAAPATEEDDSNNSDPDLDQPAA